VANGLPTKQSVLSFSVRDWKAMSSAFEVNENECVPLRKASKKRLSLKPKVIAEEEEEEGGEEEGGVGVV
jgi:hypothetical protein